MDAADRAIAVNGQPPAVRDAALQRRWRDSLQHAVTAVPLYGGGRDPLSYARHQVFLPGEVVVGQVFDLSRDCGHNIRCYLTEPLFKGRKKKETRNTKEKRS